MESVSSTIKPAAIVFCPPPPGKPNPKLPIDTDLTTPRERVPLSRQKGPTCIDYALKIIRQSIGKCPSESQKEMRAFEMEASKKRKSITALTKTWEERQELAKILIEEMKEMNLGIEMITNIEAGMMLEIVKNIPASSEEDKTVRAENCKLLELFLNQNEDADLLKFTINQPLREKIKLHEEFQKKLKLDASVTEYYQNKFQPYYNKSWSDLSLNEKEIRFASYSFKISYEKFGLQKSAWNPNQPIESLAQQLDKHGPHLVIGLLGRSYYVKDPVPLPDKVNGRLIYGWPPKALRKEGLTVRHAAIIVGADPNKKRIYYIDPLDGSNPNNVEQQRVYAMSIDRLRESICDLDNNQWTLEDKPIIFSDACNYALHGNPKINYL